MAGAVLAALTACGGIAIKPDPVLPQPLLQPLPASVGLVLPNELRNYLHKETRYAVEWQIALGPGHVHMLRDMFKDSFRHVEEFKDLPAARAGTGLKALFEPLIDQYSFVTERDTGGRYYAVTIRYRINLYTPQGEKFDTLTLTGYGSALAKGISNGAPLERATLAAMRDAAAKFLVQFPDQAAGQQLARDEPLSLQSGAATADNLQIEAVPIEESGPDGDAGAPPTQPQPPVPPTAAPAPAAPPPPADAPGRPVPRVDVASW
ncbi:MAG TPA: hypothetical protein VGD47_00985 [Steroidobacteraceae bacterium]